MIIGTPVSQNALIPLNFVKSLLAVKDYDHIFQESCSIPLNRNNIFERARIENQDLLMIDSDMVFMPADVRRMEEHLKTYDIVTGVAVMQFPGWPAAIFDEKLKFRSVEAEEMFEVGACGAAFLGISKRVLQDLVEPFTPTGTHGEDVSFCLRAKEAGYKIFCDSKLLIGHIKTETKYYGHN